MKELSLDNSRLDGRYDIIRLLGRGSYAEIYLAEDTLAGPDSPHRRVVIKALNVFMHSDLDRDLERTLVENFQNEALALDRVRHPNIISRLGHGTAQDVNGTLFHFLVLEYMPGGDLAKHIRKHDISFGEALAYLEQVCAGLAHAHSRNVIHRDIKPQNLLLSADRKIVKIADFGVARMSESEAPITRVGTNLYAPPEHSPMFSGSTGKLEFPVLTPAADVYSLAKTAYVLITGESPRFYSNRPINELPEVVRNRVWAEPLLTLLIRATAENPGDRPGDALEFWDELAEIGRIAAKCEEPAKALTEELHSRPQPAFSKGYNPTAPLRPKFDTSKELKLDRVLKDKRPGTGISVMNDRPHPAFSIPASAERSQRPETLEGFATESGALSTGAVTRRPKRLLKLALSLVLVGSFAAGLYATYNYVLTRVPLPNLSTLFGTREATALMNINLRSDPSTDNPRIGLVSKGSRLKILSSQGHWYRIEIIEHGSPSNNPDFSETGWISGKTRTGAETIAMRGER